LILPGKHLSPQRALIGVGAEILHQLDRPCDVSELWDRVCSDRTGREQAALGYDWFLLALTFLYSISAIDEADGLLTAGRGDK